MSIKFLQSLNGQNRGAFRDWLNGLNHEPRIAWYPSAGHDFRDLMFLNPRFRALSPATQPEPLPPSIFLHSDYWYGGMAPSYFGHIDRRTCVEVKHVEELPRLDLPLDPGIVHFPNTSADTGRVLFMWLKVMSRQLGWFSVPLIYVFAENAALCSMQMLPHEAQVSHLVKVRSGGGMGGGNTHCAWTLHSLELLKCEMFISDGYHRRHLQADDWVLERFPNLKGVPADLGQPIRTVSQQMWSCHGDVSWYPCGIPTLDR